MSKRIVVADDEPISRLNICEILSGAGYAVVGEVGDGFDAVELCRLHNPDLVILDIRMPMFDGLKAARMIRSEKLAKSVLMLTAFSDKEFVDQAQDAGVEGYLVKPVTEGALLAMVGVAIAKGAEMSRMAETIRNVEEQLESRKLIERAKGILMEKEKLSESEAFKRIQKFSMDKGRSMKEIAKAIVLNG